MQPIYKKPEEKPSPPPAKVLGTGMAGRAASALSSRKSRLDAELDKYADGGMVKNYAGGGMVRGPGTGTSDSIPAMVRPGSYVMPADSTRAISKMVKLSNGEQVLTPEQTNAIGVQNLDKVKSATHKMSGKPLIAAYRDGGLVDEEERRRRTAFPANVPAASPYAGMSAPSIPSGFMPGTRAVASEAGKEIRDLAGQGRIGAAIGEGARALTAYVPAIADDVLGAPVRSISSGVMDAGRQFLGMDRSPSTAQPAGVASQARAQATPNPTATPVAQMDPTSVARQDPANPSPATPATIAQPQAGTPVEGAPGAFRFGRGQYSDNASGMNMPDGFTGRPNAQNDAAASALAQRSAASNPIARMSQQTGLGNFTPSDENTGGFGLLDRGYQERRAAMMDAQQFKPGARTALSALLRRQEQAPELALRRDGMQMDQEGRTADRGLRSQEIMARMGESAADRALRSREVGDSMATNAVRREAAGMETAAARQLQQLRSEYLNAETPEAQAEAARKLQALSGKQDNADVYTGIAGGQQVVDVGGTPQVMAGPSMILNRRTGQVTTAGGSQQAAPPPAPPKDQLQPNTVYQTPLGPARWDGKQFIPV